MLLAGFLMNADDLRRLRGIQRLDLVCGLDALAADDQIVFAAQLSANLGDGGAHVAGIFFVAEIEKRLGNEWGFVKISARWPDRSFGDCHGGMHLGRISSPETDEFLFTDQV